MFSKFQGFDANWMLAAFLLTAGLLWLLQPLARRLNLLDHPAGRKDHAVPTPVTGGIAIFLAVLVLFLWSGTLSAAALSFLAASALLIVLGVLDDLHDLRWYWRILGQTAAALLIIYWGGVRVEYLGPVFGMSPTALGWLSVPFTVFATLGVINAMNMIDGVDGLCGLLGLAALAMLTAAAIYSGNALLAERLSVLVGALAGFLLWNMRLPWRPRAKVFLGNAGSAMLGLVIAWVSFRLTQTPAHPVIPVLALWMLPIPVMDCLVLIVRRLKEGRSPFSADRNHIHHILQDSGFGPTRAAVHLAWVSLLCGFTAAWLKRMQVPPPLLLLAFVLLCVGWYWLTARRERAVAFFRRLRRAPACPESRRAALPDVE